MTLPSLPMPPCLSLACTALSLSLFSLLSSFSRATIFLAFSRTIIGSASQLIIYDTVLKPRLTLDTPNPSNTPYTLTGAPCSHAHFTVSFSSHTHFLMPPPLVMPTCWFLSSHTHLFSPPLTTPAYCCLPGPCRPCLCTGSP